MSTTAPDKPVHWTQRETETHTTHLPFSESIGGNTSDRDEEVWTRLEKVIEENGHPPRHVLELFPAYARRIHMMRYLSHYELFKNIVDLPGVIVELGVYRAPSLLTWAKLMEIFVPGDRTRQVYGFDSFQGLQDFSDKDGKRAPWIGKTEGGWSAKSVRDEIYELVEICNVDNIIPRQRRVVLVEGNVFETIPKWIEEVPGARISLLHLDMDLYEPTLFALRQLWDKIVPGGVIVFDEYGLIPWEGESNAVDEFFKEIGVIPKIRKHPWTHVPHGYMIKGEETVVGTR